MVGPEFVEHTEEQVTSEAVGLLKYAAVYMDTRVTWASEDGEYSYSAIPLETPEETDLANITAGRFYEIMNSWMLTRSTPADINGEVTLDIFMLPAGWPMLVSAGHVIPLELAENEEQGAIWDQIMQENSLQAELGMNEPSLEDYAAIDNAMHDLKPIAEQAFHDHLERRSQMTEDELRWEKAQKYAWLITPEMEKTGEPKWWGFTVVSQVFAVHSASPDMAAVLLEEHLEGPLAFFFVEEYDDEYQPDFDERYEGRGIVKLIPFSMVEWPEDPQNMTDEQKEAFARLKS